MADRLILQIDHPGEHYETLQLKDDAGYLLILVENDARNCAIILDEDEIDDLYEALTRYREGERTQEARARELLVERFGYTRLNGVDISGWWGP